MVASATSFIDCRENVGTASWQESSLTQKRSERERERERGKANKA
jgi:hypothetical protein